jgi:hypothetical protein
MRWLVRNFLIYLCCGLGGAILFFFGAVAYVLLTT